MAYEVTARRWRPQEFDSVIGQEHVTTTLKNAIQSQQVAHAYLFSGPRGVGKTTTARILAKALNCVTGPTVSPCNKCNLCREISEGRSVDVLEIDGASNNRVEQVRTHLLESVKYSPSQGKHKVYIIDEVHMLTKEAFNALLKTLEEPPPHVYFIFATTDPRKVIPTVLSRCQRFDFRRISGPTIVDHLAMISEKSEYGVHRDALALIARRVDGSLRDAESLLDQIVAFGGAGLTAHGAAEILGIVNQDVYFELMDIVAAQDIPRGLDLVDRIFRQGHDLEEIILGILEHLRNLLVVQASPEAESLLGTAAMELQRYRKQAECFETEDLLRLSQLATQIEQAIKQSALPRIQLETGIARMIRLASSVQLTTVMSRLSELAQQVGMQEGNEPFLETVNEKKMELNDNDSELSESNEPPRLQNVEDEIAATSKGPAPLSSKATDTIDNEEEPVRTGPESDQHAKAADSSPTNIEFDVKKIRDRWPDIVAEIKTRRNALGILLAEAKISGYSPVEDSASGGGSATITLAFSAKHHFHKEKAEKRDANILIQKVCSELLGIPINIVCFINNEVGENEKIDPDETIVTLGPEPVPTGKEISHGTNTHLGVVKDPSVVKIVTAFDGEILED